MILIILDNYIIVDQLVLSDDNDDSFIREVYLNPKIVQVPSTPKEIILTRYKF